MNHDSTVLELRKEALTEIGQWIDAGRPPGLPIRLPEYRGSEER